MKKFRIEFADEAKLDFAKSYDWGKRNWGQASATRWYREVRAKVREILGHFPLSQSVAPESSELDQELRQMIFRRYRVIYEIDGRTVRILHLKGPSAADAAGDE
ncbi:MAG: type II toxin-antitoxin system RelE/ParE family toxin [Acidobacteriota bacterium]